MRPTLTASDILGVRGRVDVASALRILWGVTVPLTRARTHCTHTHTHTHTHRRGHARAAAHDPSRGVRDTAFTSETRTWSGAVLRAGAGAGGGGRRWILRDNVYVEKVVDPVFSAERDIPDLMLDELRTELEPLAISVVLFGSYARGDQTTESDVDLVAVGEDRSAKTALESRLATFSRRSEQPVRSRALAARVRPS